MEAAPIQAGSHLFEYILHADASLFALETGQPEALVEEFGQRVRLSGEAVYLWREGDGLRSLRETGVRVPGCLRLVDTLNYVLKSRHFGMYLIAGLKPPLSQRRVTLLRRIARTRTDFVRRVILFDQGAVLARALGELAIPLKHELPAHARLRLRDGRWVS